MPGRILWTLLLFLPPVGGCNIVAYFLHLVAPPEPMKTVKADFDGLPGNSVAVVVYATDKVAYEYPYSRLHLAAAIGQELKAQVEKVTVIDPRRVAAYQEDNIYWDRQGKTELGRRFGADFVLFVAVMEYTMREPGSINLFRGRIVAEASLYKTSLPERRARVWRAADIRVTFPERAPAGRRGEDDRQLAYTTRKRFAAKLVKKFYDHEAPKGPDGMKRR